jgi:hypothetical protein
MEIRIDTSKDSKEDIRKAIRLLESLVEDSSGQQPQQSFPSGENVFGGMFDAGDSTSSVPSAQEPQKPSEIVENKPVKKEKISISGLDVY